MFSANNTYSPQIPNIDFESHVDDPRRVKETEVRLLRSIRSTFCPSRSGAQPPQESSQIDPGSSLSSSQSGWLSFLSCCFSKKKNPLLEVEEEPSSHLSISSDSNLPFRSSNMSAASADVVRNLDNVIGIMDYEYNLVANNSGYWSPAVESMYLGGTFGKTANVNYPTRGAVTSGAAKLVSERAAQVEQVRQWVDALNDNSNKENIYEEMVVFLKNNACFISSMQTKPAHTPVNYLLLALFLGSGTRLHINRLIEGNFFQYDQNNEKHLLTIASGALEFAENANTPSQSVFFLSRSRDRRIFSNGVSCVKTTQTKKETDPFCLADGLEIYNKLNADMIQAGYYVLIFPKNGPYLVTKYRHDESGRCSLLYIDGIDPALKKLHGDAFFAYVQGTDRRLTSFSPIQNTRFRQKSKELVEREEARKRVIEAVSATESIKKLGGQASDSKPKITTWF